jgi:DcmR-like sensory protein
MLQFHRGAKAQLALLSIEVYSPMSVQSSLLTDPHPCRHIVYPYNDEQKAVNAVYLFASSGLSKGESVILIMADSRRAAITGRLADAGSDLTALQLSGRLECISAETMVQSFMTNGALDEQVVKDTLGDIVVRARANSTSGKVRVFGEMVSLLLARNDLLAAGHLEELWNQIIQTHSISLFCTYTLLNSGYTELPETISKLHSHILASWVEDIYAPLGASAND